MFSWIIFCLKVDELIKCWAVFLFEGKCVGWLGPNQPNTFTLFSILVIYVYTTKCDLMYNTWIPIWVKVDLQCEVVRIHFPASDFGFDSSPGPSRRNNLALVQGVLFISCSFGWFGSPRLVQVGEINLHQCMLVCYSFSTVLIYLVLPA